MDIEIEFDRKWNSVFPLVLLVVLALLALLGRSLTPGGDRLLTWEEWQVVRARQVYDAELNQLQVRVDMLLTLMNNNPDPVRGQMVTDQIQQELENGGMASLEPQRLALSDAALAVRNWTVNVGDRESAREAVEFAVQRLEEAAQSLEASVP